MSTTEQTTPALLARPKRADARRNYDKVLDGGARGVRRGRRVHRAGGDRTPGRRRDRHALPPLPQPAGAARGGLPRGGRGHLPVRGRSSSAADPWEALNSWFERFSGYLATKQALAAELLNYLDRDAQLFQACRAALFEGRRAAARARPGGRRRRGRTSTSPTSSRWSSGSRRSRPAIPGRPSTSFASPSTGCATARRRRPGPTSSMAVSLFTDLNCPFCYATEQRLERLGVSDKDRVARGRARARPARADGARRPRDRR